MFDTLRLPGSLGDFLRKIRRMIVCHLVEVGFFWSMDAIEERDEWIPSDLQNNKIIDVKYLKVFFKVYYKEGSDYYSFSLFYLLTVDDSEAPLHFVICESDDLFTDRKFPLLVFWADLEAFVDTILELGLVDSGAAVFWDPGRWLSVFHSVWHI